MGISSKGGEAVIMAVAVLSVVLLISAAMANDPPEPLVEGNDHQYYVAYQPNGATGNAITVGYDGIISTEYNPERWYDEDKQGLSKSTPSNLPSYSAGTNDNWTGPSYTATGTMKFTLTLSNSTTYKISVPSTYTIASAPTETWMSGDPTVDNTGDTHSVTFTTTASGGGSRTYSISLTFTANKVFGGWAIGNESKECSVVRTVVGDVETWTYSSGGTPYYRENHDMSGDTWTYESYSESVWSACSKTTDRYYLMSGADFYIPDYTNEHALYSDTFKKVESWANTAANKERESLGNDDYEDQFGNVWHKNGADSYTAKSYKVYAERQYLPGDIVPATTKALLANWIEPDVYTKQQTISSWGGSNPKTASITGDANLPQTYMTLTQNSSTDPGLISTSYSGTTVTQTSGGVFEVRYGDGRTAPSMYGSIYELKAGTTYYIGDSKGIPTGTYHSANVANKAIMRYGKYAATTSGNVIIDNVKLHGCSAPSLVHGSGSEALYATGHILIMGVGLESVNSFTSKSNTHRDIQVYGGLNSGSLTSKVDADLSTAEIDDKEMVFNTSSDNTTVSIATCLIIHSGCYYNVIAGNCKGTIGTDGAMGEKLSTYLVMKGGMVGDTVIGATSGDGSKMYSHIDNDPGDPYTKRSGGTFVYMTGGFMTGDDWVDKKTDDFSTFRETNYKLVDVSVINGSSTKGELYGTSHVFVTDHASVYDVTAAGREESSFTRFSYLEVSGVSTVRHAACGGVMNGMPSEKHLVDHTYVSIQGDCKVANVYGSGYDIYFKPDGSSMKLGGSIFVEMKGGTVGNVYGGGYRGSIGDKTDYNKLNITIDISGGHVLDSVYGGGSGGVDKAKHNSNGTRFDDGAAGFGDPVGKSYVYGNIIVNISGEDTVIDGSVYGGGKSVSALKTYKGYNKTWTPSSTNPVAMTYGEIYVNVSGGTIGGSVYGGGRGAEWEYVTNEDGSHKFVVADTTKTILMKSDGILNPIDWFECSNSTEIVFCTTEGYKAQGGTHFIYREANGVYSGAYLEFARLTGDTFVKITGGEIAHSVYGGGSNGRVIGVSGSSSYIRGSSNVEITGGKIGENVFGGGLGIEGVVAVTGNRTVFINMKTAVMNSDNPPDIIYGSVYGGSSVGDDGPYNGVNKIDPNDSGAPAVGFPKTEAKYKTYLQNTSESNSTVVITQALIGNPYNDGKGNSVFGGGFMGKTYGYVHVYIGYDYVRTTENTNTGYDFVDDVDGNNAYNSRFSVNPHTGNVVNTIFLNSVYAGGDISINEDGSTTSGVTPFDPEKPLVYGGGSASIYGNGANGNMKIVGCVMGSGNSCNTNWTTSIVIDNLINKGQMTGIHRTNSLLISHSVLDILSRSTVTEVAGSPSKSLSLFMIDDLTLKNDSAITISAPMDYIANYHSLSKDNNPTTVTSPSNKLVYTTGATLYVRDSTLQYGKVEGYTVLEAQGQGDFGAYVLGNTLSSTGGFVITKEGIYKDADYSNMGNNVKCWFIAGTQNKVVTMNMPYSELQSRAAIPASIDVVKMQSGTKIRYTGATFTTISTDNLGNSFEFVRPGTEDQSYEFGMLIGYAGDTPEDNVIYADTERYLSIGGAPVTWVHGTYYSDDPAESRGSYEPMRNEESSSARTLVPLSPVDMINKNRDSSAGTYKLNLIFTGIPTNTTMYVGYLTISLQEVDEVTYEAMDEHGNMVLRSNTMVTNNINIRADLYVIGSGDVWDKSEYKVVLKADEDVSDGSYTGYTEIIIPTGFIMGKLVLTDVETENVPSYESIKIAAVINQDSTTGWMTINSPVVWTKDGDNGSNQPIGTMSGTIVATIRYSIEGFHYPDLEEGQYPMFKLKFVTTDKNGQKVPSDVSVTIKPKPMHTVTYINEYAATTYGYYSDGSYLNASMFSNLGSNFIGWYLDSDFNNMFDYKMPITRDMTLYARFSFMVIFDNMNGTSSQMYIASNTGGAQLSENNVPKPQYTGYEFKGWYKDRDGIVAWDYAYDVITGDTTLYAKWSGIEVKVNFLYYKDGNWLLYKGGAAEEYGVSEEVPPEVTDAALAQTIDSTTHLDLFGNHYTYDGVYTMDTKSLYGPGEREYRYVVSEDRYDVFIDSEWVEVTDEAYLEDLKDLRGYSFKNTLSGAPLTYYKKVDSDNYRKIYGTLVRPVITDNCDQFGNHYAAGVMDYAIVWTSDAADGMFKLVMTGMDTGKFYRNIGDVDDRVWSDTAEETAPDTYYLRDRYSANYDVTNNFSSSAKYMMAESGFFMLLSDWMVVSPLIDTGLSEDQFGNVYQKIGESAPYTYVITEYHFYRTELELKYDISSGNYYERVGTNDGWIAYTGATSGLYFKDPYEYHYKYDGGNSKYVANYLPSGAGDLCYPDSYVMAWYDGTPYYPTVRYGSTFNTIDPVLSQTVPTNILDVAQEGVQALLGDDKFIRWQAYYDNDPHGSSSFGIYSDTLLTGEMVNLNDLGWQTGMPEINLYAVTAKVAINLIMDKNVNDASAMVAAPNTFLVYPTPNYIYWTNEYFDEDCPTIVEIEDRKKYTDGDGNYFYKVKDVDNQYVTEDGRTLLTYDSTYGYYGMTGLNYYESVSAYEGETGDYYTDKYGNIYEGGTSPSNIIERRLYSENASGIMYKIDASTGNFQVWNGSSWENCDRVTNYYFVDGNGNRYVKTDDTQYRMIDWDAAVFGYDETEPGVYQDTLGLGTVWSYDGANYTLESCDTVFKEGSPGGYIYKSVRTTEPAGPPGMYNVIWTYYHSTDSGIHWTEEYMEFYNPMVDVWLYSEWSAELGNWVACSKDNDYYVKDSSNDKYTRFDDCKFGKHEWAIKEAEITAGVDQFGNHYDGDVLEYSIVYVFENEYKAKKDVVSQSETVWIFYQNGTEAVKQKDVKVTPGSGESTHVESVVYYMENSAWQETYHIIYVEYTPPQGYTNGNIHREIQRYLTIQGDTGWFPVYTEDYNVETGKWTYKFRSGEYTATQYTLFYYKDSYNNHFNSFDNVTYNCVSGSETYYSFSFKLNEATRNGYKLTGWHNTHVNIDDALYPTSGIYRTIKLFYHEEAGITVINKEVLTTTDILGLPVTFINVDYNEYEAENPGYSYASYNGKALPRLDDPMMTYNITYLAQWAPMSYTVTITQPAVGNIDAFLVSANGDRTPISGSTQVKYGDRIELSYSASGVYQFNRWMSAGECSIENVDSSSTTLVVHGNCSISVSEIGERLVSLTMRFDAGALSEEDHEHVSVWLENNLTGERYRMQHTGEPGNYELYRGYVPLNSNDPNEEYQVIVMYDDEEYYMKTISGELRVGKDTEVDHTFELISARIRQSIQIKDEHGEIVNVYSSIDGVRLTQDKLNELKIGDRTVVTVTRYVGASQEFLENDRDIINNPYNGIPPVKIYIESGFDYITFEGFPDENEYGEYYFNINEDYNYHAGYSYERTEEHFDLNWTRTDAPAEIIVQLTTNNDPGYAIKYTVGNPGGDTELRDWCYNGARLVRDGDLVAQIGLAEADIASRLTAKGKSIQGWYYDKNLTKPVAYNAIIDSDVVSYLELNKDSGYHLYAKVVDSANMATITVKLWYQDENGDLSVPPDSYSLNIVKDDGPYTGTISLDQLTGFHVRREATYTDPTVDADYTGTFNVVDNTVVSYVTNVTYDPEGVKTGGTLNLYYDRNTVILQINRTDQESTPGEPWVDDKVELRVGKTQALPVLQKGSLYVNGWTTSPTYTPSHVEKVSDHNYTYTVGMEETGTIYLTAQYTFTNPVNVTFITPKGYYSDNLQNRITITVESGERITTLPKLITPEGYTLNELDKYPGYSPETEFVEDVSFTANLDIVKHNFTFRANSNGEAEVSATNDSSIDLLNVGKYNSLEHHSEISITVKPAKGKTIDVNTTKAWAYVKQNSGEAVPPEYTELDSAVLGATWRDQFYNGYDGNGGDLVYSLIWVYNTTTNQEHSAGEYVSYIVIGGTFYKNNGTGAAPVCGDECDPIATYYYKDGGVATGDDYVKDGTNFQKKIWVPFTSFGSPTKLSDDRGYLWSFFLDADTDVVIHTTVVSVNINFVVNGESITEKEGEYMTVWGLTGSAQQNDSYLLGRNIPMYSKVEFFGYSTVESASRVYSNVHWYKDRACTIEYPYTTVEVDHVQYHKYEFLATEDLTVYAVSGKVAVNMYNNDGTAYRAYLLDIGAGDKITLPELKYIMDGYIFVGWGEKVNDEIVFKYGPQSSFNPGAETALDLYAYYLKGGVSQTVPYDSDVHAVEITQDTTPGQAVGNTLHIRYSTEGPISSLVEGVSVLEYEDFVEETVYYYGELTSATTGDVSRFSGSFTYSITKIELYIIAPSRSWMESYDLQGNPTVHTVSSGSINMIATTSDGKVPNPDDIAAVVLDTEMPGYSDRIAGVGSVRTAASIYFAEGKAEDYIIHYVDGSLVVYPMESARYMYGGF